MADTLLRLLAFAFFLWPASQSRAQSAYTPSPEAWKDYLQYLRETKGVVDIRPIHNSGSGAHAFNLMLVSAGFRADEADDFYKVCQTFSRSLFQEDPWKKYENLVNIYGVCVDDESPDNTRVQVIGYKGQILACQNQPAIQFANYAGRSDNTAVIHNSNFSTPTCGPWAMVTCHRGTAGEYRTLFHELGHSVGGLGDTYTQRQGAYDGSIKNLWEGKNSTDQPNPLLSHWHYWTQDRWPGIFNPLKLPDTAHVTNVEGGAWAKGFYRPEEECVMRGGNSPSYCTVCNEVMETCFFRTINLFEEASPEPGECVLWKSESIPFHLKALKFIRDPKPWLKSRLELHLDGKPVATSSNGEIDFEFGGEMATPGYHQLGANLDIQADHVRRDDGFLGASRAWRVKVMPYEKPRVELPSSVKARQGDPLRVPLQVEHSRKDLVKIQVSHAPPGAALQGAAFTWPVTRAGAWCIDFTVSVEGEKAFTKSMEIHVKPNNGEGAKIELAQLDPVDALVGKETVTEIKATADKGGQLLYQLLNPEPGMDLDRETGKLTWTPSVDQCGPHRLRFRVSNGATSAEGHVLIGVCKEPGPYANSYLTTYIPDRNRWLEEHRDSPLIYEKVFELSRMLRERFSSIYTPALEEAQAIYPDLDPGVREAFVQELARYTWNFVDRPNILEWLAEISKNGDTPNARKLRQNLADINLWRKVKDAELGGDPRLLGALLAQFAKTDSAGVRSAIRRAVKSLYAKADDKESFRREVRQAIQRSEGSQLAAMLPMLPDVEMPGIEELLLKVALDPDEMIARSAWDTINKVTASGTPADLGAFSKLLVTASDGRRRSVISRIVKGIADHIDDRRKTQTTMLDVLEKTEGPGRIDLLHLLPLVAEPRLDALLEELHSGPDPKMAGAASKALTYLREEIGATEGFIASWRLSGPYPMKGANDTFAPERGEPAEWVSYQCQQQGGPRIVPLNTIFGGDNRVAYMKATIHSDKERTVLFGAGSDDGIDVWLNGRLIHSIDAGRPVVPDQDEFTGTLRAGENEIFCKIKQYILGWGGCVSIRAPDGGPALGVSVAP